MYRNKYIFSASTFMFLIILLNLLAQPIKFSWKRAWSSSKSYHTLLICSFTNWHLIWPKTVAENWVSKQITFLFYKIESWNFQHLLEKEFCKTSQNFNSIRQPIEEMKITIVWMRWISWIFVRFHEIQFQTDAESFSFLSWKICQEIFKRWH